LTEKGSAKLLLHLALATEIIEQDLA
jgi:hypothetical protein